MKGRKNKKDVIKAKPVLFSDHCGVEKEKFEELGIFNPILNFDTKLFVETILLKASKSEIIRNSINSYNKFFSNILKLLRASNEEGDKMWRAAKDLVYFPEYKSTCIGYGADSIHGSGAGHELSDQILRGAKDIIDAAKGDPDIFLLAPLLEKGIGPDLISDMTQRIIDDEICQFTVDAMEKLGIKGSHTYKTKAGNSYLLPYNSFSKCPVKLLPRDILSELPLAENFDSWLVEIADHNHELRENVSKLIGEAWYEATKAQKKESLLNELKTNKVFFIEILKVLREYSFEHYDIQKDYQGLYRWLANSEQFLKLGDVKLKAPEESQESLLLVVEEVVRNFQNLIEKNELWRMFWTKHKNKSRHVRELYSQMLFFMMAKSWVSAQDMGIELIKKVNQEVKQLEFNFVLNKKFSVTVLVKHSNNTKLENSYDKQIKLGFTGVKAFFVVMNFDEEKSVQFATVSRSQNLCCKVVEIDVINREEKEEKDWDDAQGEFEWDDEPEDWDLFEKDDPWEEDEYTAEKRKGGSSSYKKYKPFKDKFHELCLQEMEKRNHRSAEQLCKKVAKIIEDEHPHLLNDFEPYQKFLKDGGDWLKPTVYRWSNRIYQE